MGDNGQGPDALNRAKAAKEASRIARIRAERLADEARPVVDANAALLDRNKYGLRLRIAFGIQP